MSETRATVHRLKTVGIYWDAVAAGLKTFEVRVNDRAFQTGDVLELVRLSDLHTGYDTGPDRQPKIIRKRITYLLQGGQFGIEPRYCVLGLGDTTPPHGEEG
jgi:hypothetical protein